MDRLKRIGEKKYHWSGAANGPQSALRTDDRRHANPATQLQSEAYSWAIRTTV